MKLEIPRYVPHRVRFRVLGCDGINPQTDMGPQRPYKGLPCFERWLHEIRVTIGARVSL